MTTPSTDEGTTAHSVLLLIGRMDGKLDLLLTRHDQHERRLAALEGWKNRAVGWLAAVGAASGAASAKIAALLDLLL